MRPLAHNDRVRFLQRRALELRPGGYLLVSTLRSVPDPKEANGAAASGRGIYRAHPGKYRFELWLLTVILRKR